MRLKRHEAVQDDFPYWDKCAVRIEDIDLPMCVICPREMDALLSREKAQGGFVAVPTFISHDERGVRVFPRPDRAYEVVAI